jgi:hypothetical protein
LAQSGRTAFQAKTILRPAQRDPKPQSGDKVVSRVTRLGDDMIFKIFSPKNSAKKLAFFDSKLDYAKF